MKNPADTDRRAFEHFHEQHRMFVWKLCYWHANYNTVDAADLFQDVSLALWHRFHTLRPNASRAQQRAWIWFIAHSLFLRLIPAPSPQPLTDDMADQLADNPTTPAPNSSTFSPPPCLPSNSRSSRSTAKATPSKKSPPGSTSPSAGCATSSRKPSTT